MRTIYMDMTSGTDPEQMARAGQILLRGGLVAFPTETVYGLGANALDKEAAAKIYAAKGRPSDNPLIVHIADLASLETIAREVPESAYLLAERFWPGPLTMILRKKEGVPDTTTGGLPTVAVRMPSHPAALELIRQGGGFVAAPSANTSGRPSPTTAGHVAEDLDGKIDVIIDGGPVGIGLESTIVDLTEPVPVILRPGAVNLEMLRETLGDVEVDKALYRDDPDLRPKAPGMKYRHYAPKADMMIVEGPEEEVTAAIERLVKRDLDRSLKVGILSSDEGAAVYSHLSEGEGASQAGKDGGQLLIKRAGGRSEEEKVAGRLYRLLREFDAAGVDVIYSEAFDTPRLGQAIMNRLVKAAGRHVRRAKDVLREEERGS